MKLLVICYVIPIIEPITTSLAVEGGTVVNHLFKFRMKINIKCLESPYLRTLFPHLHNILKGE
jgi:hypothetical protein